MAVPVDPQSYADKYWSKVDRSGGDDACWPWIGKLNWAGYGTFYTGGWPYQEHAHRTALRLSGTEPPRGGPRHGVVDHMCRNRACCNPKHLRIVSQRVNTLENNDSPFAQNARKTHCKYGHPLSGENIRLVPTKTKKGRACVSRKCLKCYGPGGERRKSTRAAA